MSQQQLDAQGEAHEALGSAVASYGQRILGDPRTLGNLVADLLPDLPRERSLLVTGAEAGIAAEMTQHVEEQHLDADTAVQLAARKLSEGRAIDPAASMWVAHEYAQALGYQVRPYLPPPSVSTGGGPDPGKSRLPTTTWPPRHRPGEGSSPTPTRDRRRGVIAVAAAAGVVVLYLIVAAAAHTVPFAKSKPAPSPSAIPAPSHHKQSPKPTLTPSLAAGVAPLTQLLPSDIADSSTDCQTETLPHEWAMPGLAQALDCTDPGLPNGQLDAYQMKSSADFETAWHNFNKFWKFDISSAGASCPPSGGHAEGTAGWHSNIFPATDGQVVECQIVGSGSGAQPAFAWAMPTEDAFFVAQGAERSSFGSLNTWWLGNSGPAASPSPSAP